MFSAEIIKELQHYVYRLVDPRDNQTFYVGKGQGNRVFMHARGEIDAQEDELTTKLALIREIKNAGYQVAYIIHRHKMDKNTAINVEAALIDAYTEISPKMANKVSGHHSNIHGAMTVEQIIRLYQAEAITSFAHKVLMINVNRSFSYSNDTKANEKEVYEAVRYAWRINHKRAERAEVVLAVQYGFVVGVFIAEKWLQSTKENFPEKDNHPSGRWGFIGHTAPETISTLYINKRIPADMRKTGSRSPLHYSYTA